MGLGRALAVALVGVDGHLVQVEADVAPGLPAFTLVGLPDTALAEARDRVRAAMANAGCALPARRITVNLSPAALPKAGTSFDLAVATALLAATGAVDPRAVARCVHLGELGLDGRLQRVRGVLPAVIAAVRAGRDRVVVPAGNAEEARLVPGARVVAARWLPDVLALHRGEPLPDPPEGLPGWEPEPVPDGAAACGPGSARGGLGRVRAAADGPVVRLPAEPDLAEVVGQGQARYALEVAAAGGHHLLLLGPPGAGKTMLAARLPGLLPDLPDAQAIEVTAVHSVAGTLDPAGGLLRRPPFEDPHHTATVSALVGGGSGLPRPGAASRAHRGVLFLDEAAEFDTRALEALRQPLEAGELVIHRALGTARFPARFQLVLAANPCPCGMAAGRGEDCSCTPLARRRYLSRLSGPLLDRVDLQVEVLAVSRAEMSCGVPPEPSREVAARVLRAREKQRTRLVGTPWSTNGELPGSWLRGPLRLDPAATLDLDRGLDRGSLSIRGYDRVLRAAWTIADLDGLSAPGRDEVGRALLLRQRGQVAG
ncbi:MAG TPA: YifB family Mg chelatase-like AAA ATPase [Kineosporiaceae bacterium]|nr:YifB family Mg chelatase-like AAA ATPase [Kineosporiaceae bacterium]